MLWRFPAAVALMHTDRIAAAGDGGRYKIMINEKEFYKLLWLCVQILWIGVPHTIKGFISASYLTFWTIILLVSKRYLFPIHNGK